jgi:hypothetical protein
MTNSVREKNKDILDLNQLEQASGGGLFSPYSDEQYAAAGVTVVGPGWFDNDGYKLNGEEMKRYQASALVYYYLHVGKRAPSIEEALRYSDETAGANHPANCNP